jgi:hypothetical protein
MLHSFCWVIPRRFGILSHIHRWCKLPAYNAYEDVTGFPKRRHVKFLRRGITQNKLYSTVSSMRNLAFRSPNKFSRGAYGINPIQAVNFSQKLTVLSPLLYLVRAYTFRTIISHENPPKYRPIRNFVTNKQKFTVFIADVISYVRYILFLIDDSGTNSYIKIYMFLVHSILVPSLPPGSTLKCLLI